MNTNFTTENKAIILIATMKGVKIRNGKT